MVWQLIVRPFFLSFKSKYWIRCELQLTGSFVEAVKKPVPLNRISSTGLQFRLLVFLALCLQFTHICVFIFISITFKEQLGFCNNNMTQRD